METQRVDVNSRSKVRLLHQVLRVLSKNHALPRCQEADLRCREASAAAVEFASRVILARTVGALLLLAVPSVKNCQCRQILSTSTASDRSSDCVRGCCACYWPPCSRILLMRAVIGWILSLANSSSLVLRLKLWPKSLGGRSALLRDSTKVGDLFTTRFRPLCVLAISPAAEAQRQNQSCQFHRLQVLHESLC